jgi:perosamine synthetase
VATNSCTSALILALAALEVGPEDEVVLPSYTCLAVLNAVVQTGAQPRLTDNAYDPGRMDYNLTADHVRAALRPRTRVIIVPHMFGTPAEVDKICQLGIPVIEDITLSLGAVHAGKPVGAWGDFAVCSFHESKMVACGEGGMLWAADAALGQRVRWLNGWGAEQPLLRLKEGECETYQLRYNFRLTDPAAALGISQLAKLPLFVSRRRALAARYTARLAHVANLATPAVGDTPNVFHRYLVAREGLDVVAAIRRFAAAGVEVGRGVYPPLHRYRHEDAANYPAAEHAVATLLSIPIYPAMTDAEVEYLLSTSEAILSGN